MFSPVPVQLTRLERLMYYALSPSKEPITAVVSKLLQGKPLTSLELNILGGKYEAALLMSGGNSFDLALPEVWLRYWTGDEYRTVRDGTVWIYPSSSLQGEPLPLTEKAAHLIAAREQSCSP